MFFLSLIALAAVLLVITFNLNNRLANLNKNIENLQAEKQRYNQISQEIKKIKKNKKKLIAKIDTIKTLKNKSQIPVRLLDTITTAVSNPEDSMWLRNLTQDGPNISLSGVAMDNTRLARFMDDLTSSRYFQETYLGQSSMTKVADHNLKSFKLTLTVHNPKINQEEEGKKK